MIRIIPLILIAAPVFAGETDHWRDSTATLGQCPAADACVTVLNMLTGSPDVVSTTLTMDGLQVEITAVMGAGDLPDHIWVVAPAGWRVDPSDADIPEGGSGVFLLFAPMMSGNELLGRTSDRA